MKRATVLMKKPCKSINLLTKSLFLCLTAVFLHLKNLNDILFAITLKHLSGYHSLIDTLLFKLKVLKTRIGRINLKVILRRFTFFIKEIQNKKHFVKRPFTDIKSSLFLV